MIKSLSLAGLLFALSALVGAAENDTITIEHAWAPESPPMVSNGAAYMTIIASGGETDRLIGASGDVAEAIELHTHSLEDNIMKMRPMETIEVNPGEPTVLRPGGLHIMLIKLNQPLVDGQRFLLMLHFAKAGDVPVEVTVRKVAGTVMPPKGHQGHGDIRH
jgi:copper(I)-binding protein